MSNLIQLTYRIEDIGLLDFDTEFAKSVDFPLKQQVYMQVTSITISDRIPNIFDANPYYDFNNTLLRVGTNIEPYQTIALRPGLYYSADLIADAINAAVGDLGWWLDNDDPGFEFGSNTITDQIIITIDPNKLNPIYGSSLKLDLRRLSTGTDIADTLGFTQAVAELTSPPGVETKYTSNTIVRMDTQGTSCDIRCDLMKSTIRNNKLLDSLAVVPFAGKTTLSDNVWPQGGQISPMMLYTGTKNLKKVSVRVRTMEEKPMIFMSGRIFINIEFKM
jgi:hypothetical protein